MSKAETISIPSLALNYVDNRLESIGYGGELYHRERTLRAIDSEMMRSGGVKSRYEKLFGTPERAAETLETVAESLYAYAWSDDNATLSDVLCTLVAKCGACPAKGAPGRGVSTKCGEVDYNMMLEWLRSDA